MPYLIIIFLLIAVCACADIQLNPLTPEEEQVIVYKGTEHPFTGTYDKHFEPGNYDCKRCGEPLYKSDSKFDSGCGWPAFDEEIPGAVKRVPDADSRRTEIVCARCGGHLGHVFLGEGLTSKNTRHCVNSISLTFNPLKKQEKESASSLAIFSGGCFWGVEFFFQNVSGVLSTRTGYIGGNVPNPSYQDVCGGKTGHVEALEVVYDPGRISYETLARLFFEIHDPTQVNRQGPDMGEQYRSAVFYVNNEQRDIALHLIEDLKGKGYKVATTVEKVTAFWPAEEYHQQYYTKKNGRPYCHAYQKRF